jgi:hypothetical protein
MLRTRLAVVGSLVVVAGVVSALAAVGLATPAESQQVVPKLGLAEGLHADITETFTNTHVTYGPQPTVSVTAGQAPQSSGILNFSLPVGAGSFDAGQMFVSTSDLGNRVESSASLSDGFDFLDLRGDGLETECSAGAAGATGTTTLENVLYFGPPELPTNPAPNTVVQVSALFTLHLNEQQVTTGPNGSRIEITAVRADYQGGGYRGSYSFGHIVCQYGTVGLGEPEPPEPPEPPTGTSPEPPTDTTSKPTSTTSPKPSATTSPKPHADTSPKPHAVEPAKVKPEAPTPTAATVRPRFTG